jgi:3-dehydroquinate synthase
VLTEVPGGERVKDVRHAGRLWQWLGEHGLTREDVLVAVGGGATTDLGGFVAATWLRGMRYVAIPTSVLAMADASIGAKTGINLALGKNLIGAFHPPALVWLPLGALHTLPGREFRAGLAEIAKIFAVLDREAWHGLRRDAAELKRRSVGHLRPHLLRAIELKAMIVAGDPREGMPAGATPPRALLNFGHTLGHAFEAASGYTLRHGEAVALGMVAAAELSEAMDLCETGVAAEIRAGLQALDLPTRWETHVTDAALAHLDQDKKRRGGLLGFIALANLGAARISPCRVDHLVAMIRVLGAPMAPAVRGR